ncbi:uncharacterized protein DSM5745_04889 [Aspergillus mulundensis]|uniref:Uncharacterized protein n=1 Tax=Aspergillus mulundensis TaxID=1810919 RepID=A0A3D8S4W1_9EURO|nr:hypothetical protein DSM5745_04889 [Aspergillus mulundensis]RDW81332.1 hypothetical protein DSM5745_04889 [Aspergillus mulundensis]
MLEISLPNYPDFSTQAFLDHRPTDWKPLAEVVAGVTDTGPTFKNLLPLKAAGDTCKNENLPLLGPGDRNKIPMAGSAEAIHSCSVESASDWVSSPVHYERNFCTPSSRLPSLLDGNHKTKRPLG